MNILHLVHRYSPVIGGAEKYMKELSESFVHDGHSVTVYTTNARDIDYFFDSSHGEAVDSPSSELLDGVQVTRFKVAHFPLRKKILRLLSLMPSWQVKCLFQPYQMLVPDLFRKTFQPHNVDIVHASASPFTSLLFMAMMLAKRNNVPFVITPFLHLGEEGDESIRREHSQPHQVRLWKQADAILVNTKVEKDFIAGYGITPERIHLIGVGVNPEQLTGGEGKRFRYQYHIVPNEHLIAHIARWDKNKGTIQLLDALNILVEQGRKVRLALLGAPTPEFKKYWLSVPDRLKQHCLLLEYADDGVKNDLLDAMDIFVMPSRVESFGIVYFESWLYKKPVIGANIPAIREIINNESDGFLVKFGDAAGLAEKMSILLDNISLSLQMGETGYRKTTSQYNFHQKYSIIRSIYQNLIDKKSIHRF